MSFSHQDERATDSEKIIASLEAQLAERNAQLAERDRQLAEIGAQLGEILSSRTWRFIVVLRKLRIFLAPPNSLRSWLLKNIFSLALLPFAPLSKIRLIQEKKILQKSLFDVAEKHINPLVH